MAWDDRMRDFRARREAARGMGGPERLARRRAEGKLNARERVDRLADPGSFLEIGAFNTSDVAGMAAATPADSKIAGFARIDGRPVALCSNDFTVLAATSSRVASRKEADLKALAVWRGVPIVYLAEAGGARMPDIMGSAGIALVLLHDIPGFFVGRDAERRRVPAKIITWMEALAMVTVPKVSVIVRKTYGQAYFNMGGGGYADLLVAWPTAEMSFMDPETGVNVVHGAELAAMSPAERSQRRRELLTQWELDTLPYGAAARHLVDDVIDPAETRDVILRYLEVATARSAVGQHRLASWPTKF